MRAPQYPREWGPTYWERKTPVLNGRLLDAFAQARRSGDLYNPVVQEALASWRCDPDNPDAERQVREAITLREVERAHYPFDTVAPDVLDVDGIPLGHTPDGIPVRVLLHELLPGLAFGASSGSGKTVLFYNVVASIANATNVVAHIIDYHGGKDAWRGLLRLFHDPGRDFCVLPWKRARINPFNMTVGVARDDLVGDLADDLRDGLDINTASMRYVRTAGASAAELTPQCVLDELRRIDSTWTASVIEKVSEINDTFAERLVKGWSMRDLARRTILWEFNGLDRSLQAFLTMRLIRSAFRQKVHDKDDCTLLFVIDEANRVFNEGSSISEFTSTVRAAKIGFLLGFQSVTGSIRIAELVVDNMPVRVLGRLGSEQSFAHYAGSVGVRSKSQLDYARRVVRPGQVLVKVPQSNDPIVVCYPNLIPSSVSDDEVEASLAPLLALPVVKRGSPIEIDERTPSRDRLSDSERVFLSMVCDDPFTHQTELYRRLGGRADVWGKVKDKLVTAGLLRPYADTLGSARGRPRTYLEPLPSAFEFLGRERVTYGRGGFAHALYTRLVGCQLEREGFLIGYEHALSTGQSCDVYATRDDVALAVEVELSARHRDNLKKVVHHAVTYLVVVAPPLVLLDVQKAARVVLGTEDLARVVFVELSAAVNAARLIPTLIPLAARA